MKYKNFERTYIYLKTSFTYTNIYLKIKRWKFYFPCIFKYLGNVQVLDSSNLSRTLHWPTQTFRRSWKSIGSADSLNKIEQSWGCCGRTGQRRNAVLPQKSDFISDQPMDSLSASLRNVARIFMKAAAAPFQALSFNAAYPDHTSWTSNHVI